MTNIVQIYVALPEEAVDVWTPVLAQRLTDNTYRILDQPYDRDDETWQFEPGDTVLCQMMELDQGPALVATEKAPKD